MNANLDRKWLFNHWTIHFKLVVWGSPGEYKRNKFRTFIRLSGWWLNQPIWKICSSKWVHLHQFSGWKFQKNIWVATTQIRFSSVAFLWITFQRSHLSRSSNYRWDFLWIPRPEFAIQSSRLWVSFNERLITPWGNGKIKHFDRIFQEKWWFDILHPNFCLNQEMFKAWKKGGPSELQSRVDFVQSVFRK